MAHDLNNPTITATVLKLFKKSLHLVVRFYLTCILLAIQWGIKIAHSMVAPFEPVLVEIRKVPKKDISLEGIFYQFVRLQFLIFLFFWSFVYNPLVYSLQPVVQLKDRIVEYLNQDSDVGTKMSEGETTILREG